MEVKKHATKQWMNQQEIKEEIKKFMGTNENENTVVQNLLDAAKVILREKFIAIQAHHRNKKNLKETI